MANVWYVAVKVCEKSFFVVVVFDALDKRLHFLFSLYFEGRGRRVLYSSPRNPEAQGEDEQGGQEEKEEIQNKMCINVNKPFLSL